MSLGKYTSGTDIQHCLSRPPRRHCRSGAARRSRFRTHTHARCRSRVPDRCLPTRRCPQDWGWPTAKRKVRRGVLEARGVHAAHIVHGRRMFQKAAHACPSTSAGRRRAHQGVRRLRCRTFRKSAGRGQKLKGREKRKERVGRGWGRGQCRRYRHSRRRHRRSTRPHHLGPCPRPGARRHGL